mgnify:CR=1 FL=1
MFDFETVFSTLPQLVLVCLVLVAAEAVYVMLGFGAGLIAVGGLALLLPGFITDAIGFLLLIPPVRRALIIRWLKSRGTLRPGDVHVHTETRSERIIEGDYRRDD